jgi:hypothetical protein
MDPISLTGFVFGAVPLLLENVRNPGLLDDFIHYHILDGIFKLDIETRTGEEIAAKLRTLLLQTYFPSVWHQKTIIEKYVLPGSKDVAEQFRISYVSDCNMSAVAVCGYASFSTFPDCPSASGVSTGT